MKKLITFILIAIMCVLPLSSCTINLSDTMADAFDNLYESIRDFAEPYLKEDEKYESDDYQDSLPDGAIDENAGAGIN